MLKSAIGNYLREIRRDSPLSLWPLWDSSTNATDQSGTNPGTYNGTYVQGMAGPSTIPFSRSVQFDGSTSNITASTFTLAAYTWELWIKSSLTVITGSGIKQPLLNGTTASGAWGYSYTHTNASFNNAAFHQNSSGTFFASALPTTPPLNVWNYVVGTWDGTSIFTSYLNGVQGASNSGVTSAKAPTANFSIGGVSTVFQACNCAYVAVYNYALSSSRIQAHYNAGLGKLGPRRRIIVALSANAGGLLLKRRRQMLVA